MKTSGKFAIAALMAVAATLSVYGSVMAQVTRQVTPNSPIASVVQVPGNTTTYYLSGMVPSVVKKEADPRSQEAFGDVETQTVSVLGRIQSALESNGLTMADVVKMQVFLVHTDKAPMDFKGFSQGYNKFFESLTAKPARSTMGVAALVNPGWLVEIEVTAVKAK